MPSADFILASASPRRKDLLCQIGACFAVRPVDIDETPAAGEPAADYVARLARTKAEAGYRQSPGLPVMGADTTVTVDGRLLGKPADEAEAIAMLMALSGRSHSVLTAVTLVSGDRAESRLSETRVTFGHLSEAECRRYWRTGEPAGKAGAYAIQGLGAVFVTAIEGSYSGVVGLPLADTRELLELFQLRYWQQSHHQG